MSENNLNVFNEVVQFANRRVFCPKPHDARFVENYPKKINSVMLTSINRRKRAPDYIDFFDKAANEIFSTTVSKVGYLMKVSLNQ